MKQFIWKKRGEITIAAGVLVTIVIFLFGLLQTQISGTNSNAKQASEKAQGAVDKTAELRADLSVVKNDVGWIRNLLERQQQKL